MDDQPLDVELALLALSQRDLEECVVVAEDGLEAMNYLRRAGSAWPRVVLLDLNMPGLGGDRVLEEIRGNPSWQDIRVVILTTSSEERDRRACVRADRFLVKPLTHLLFLGLVDELINDGLLPRPGGACS
ncbi:response regulator [Deinococcus planocerae]|uniref:response regulator n=1 Tax=Deinococcus planocerae TaxID=1737569 RepID=UPI0015E07FDB|nr:response regulator [Deinococcus planocerae]